MLLELLSVGEEAGGAGWRMHRAKLGREMAVAILRLFFHSQQPFSLTQVCALPMATAVIQLAKCVNSN